MTAPPTFEKVADGRAVVLTRPGARTWVDGVLADGVTLHESARGSAERVLEGRGPVYVMPATVSGGARWAVRRYRRGGWLRSLDDRYLIGGTPRPFRELAASEAVRARRVPTPVVVCAAVYRNGMFYRGDLVTEYVADSRDLASVMFPDAADACGSDEAIRVAALVATGRLLRQMAAAGVRHRDVNAKNVLLHGDPADPGALLLDLDRCVVDDPPRPAPVEPVYRRLLRSLAKWEARTGRRLSDEETAALESSVGGRS